MTCRVLLFCIGLLVIMPGGAAMSQSAFTAGELETLEFHQHPGTRLPLGARFVDDEGKSVGLGDFFGARPVILVLDYLRCKTLCGFALSSLAGALDRVPLVAGHDFSVIALSINPREGPADSRAAHAKYRARGRGGDGWHFLTGDEADIRQVAAAVGFPYRYDAAADQYAHPAGVTVIAPDGIISRYILGIDYRPLDLRLALTEAGKGAISSPATNLLLLCYCYDPATGRYSGQVNTAMRVLAALTVIALIGLLLQLSRAKKAGSR